MNKAEIKAVLEKQLQLLSEHSETSACKADDMLNKDVMSILLVTDRLMQLQEDDEDARSKEEFFQWEKRIDRQYRIGMWAGLATMVISAAVLILKLL